MLITIEGVLSPEEVAAASAFMAQGEFIDGKMSAGIMAAKIKHNQELAQDSDIFKRLNAVVFEKLKRDPRYQAATLPNKMTAPYYSRYTEGMYYGAHVDNPLMGNGPYLRTDVSTTLYLSDPDSYTGGETCVMTDFGEQRVKLAAGSALVYPSSSLHHVAKVESGERLAMILWAQSSVKDPAKRAILYDIWQSRESLLADQPGAENTQRIDHVYANLVRMWAEV